MNAGDMNQSNPTMSVEVRSWTDPLEEGRTEFDWPRPNEHVEYFISGHLADLIRARTGEVGEVFFEEVCVEGGYSEWTVEYDYAVTIKVGAFKREFEGRAEFGQAYDSAIPKIQRWLDEVAS